MSELISPYYQELNRELHKTKGSYGASGHRWADKVAQLWEGGTILDYGCGKGTLKQVLPDLPINEYDPAIPGKGGKSPHRWVVCTDVLEHIEPELLDNVLADIASVTLHKAFLVIATRKANKTLRDGRNAHLIVQPKAWWLERLGEHFEVEEVDDNVSQPGEFTCIVRAK